MKTIKVGNTEISEKNLFFIIEEGNYHQGNFNKALKMIETASDLKADAIEFQLAKTDGFYIKGAKGYAVWQKLEFSNLEIRKLVNYSKERNIEFIATPLSTSLVDFLADCGCSAFNINASDLTNPDIIDAVVKNNLPFFLSLPLANELEMQWVLNRIKSQTNQNFVFLLGQHTMASGDSGVDVNHTNLGFLTTLKENYSDLVGFIDHTRYFWMPSVAVASGANIVSKHLTLSRIEKGPDWHICLEPEEMLLSIKYAKQVKESMNNKTKMIAPGENMDKSEMRRSIVAAQKINKDSIIKRNDLVFKRPGIGISPMDYESILEKTATRNIEKDEIINLSDIK